MPDLIAVVAVVVPATAYSVGLRRLWKVAGHGRVVSVRQAWVFALGLFIEAIALCTPLAEAADDNLALHMVQHVLLLGVVAPLFGVGAPLPTLLWALPIRARRRMLTWWRKGVATTAGTRWARWLVATWILHIVTMVVWHVPMLYEAAVRNEILHGSEHLVFVLTSAMFWWVAVGSGRRAHWGQSVLAMFLGSLVGIALGASMTFAAHPWYPVYGTSASALTMQQLAGVVMWSFGGIATLVGAIALLVAWLDTERESVVASAAIAQRVEYRGNQAEHAYRASHGNS